jgi:hypothetical protein
MANDLLYIVEHRRAPGLLDAMGASFELVVPRTLAMAAPDNLEGRRIWVVARAGDHDVLALVGFVEAVAEVDEEVSAGDYILELDKRRSFKTVGPRTEKTHWQVDVGGASALHECPAVLGEAFQVILERSLGVKLAAPAVRPAARPWNPADGIPPVAQELVRVNGTAALGDLSGFRSIPALSPIGTEVFLSFKVADGDREALMEIVRKLDPLVSQPTPDLQSGPSLRFDATLLPLDPDRVFARTYRSSKSFMDIRLGLEKTQAAERFHQALVRRLARGLMANGVQPLATRSLDLAFVRTGVTHIVEVKSAYPENYISQFLKGLSQLLYYEAELRIAGPGDFVGHLVLGVVAPVEEPAALSATALRAGVSRMTVVERLEDESPMVEVAKRLLETADRTRDGQGQR